MKKIRNFFLIQFWAEIYSTFYSSIQTVKALVFVVVNLFGMFGVLENCVAIRRINYKYVLVVNPYFPLSPHAKKISSKSLLDNYDVY